MIAILFALLFGVSTAVAQEQPAAGNLGKFRPPVSLNGRALAPGQHNSWTLHVDDVVKCGQGGDVTLHLGSYIAHLKCPATLQIPHAVSEPGPPLKPGAKIALYRLPMMRAAYTPCGNGSASVSARGGGDEAPTPSQTPFLTCACPEDITDGVFCIDNERPETIWYVRVRPSAKDSPGEELLQPDQQIVHGQVWQFNIATATGRCVVDINVDFEDGSSAQWRGANLCRTPAPSREWQIK